MLAARIAELGLTEQEFADRLNDAVRDATGVPGKATSRYLRLLMDGTVRWPWRSRRQALEEVLGLPILELGFIPLSGRGHSERDSRPAVAPVAAVGPEDPSAVEVVGVADGRPLTIDLPQLPAGRVGFTDLDRLAGPLAQLYNLRDRYGPSGLAPAAARQATRLAALHSCDMSARVRNGLHALTGEWYAAAASLAVAAGDQAQAGRYLHSALWRAAIARDPLLDAYIAHVMATRATQVGAHAEAAAVASTMLRRAPGTAASRWIAATGHLHAAAAHAAQGGLRRAERSLDMALDALRAAATVGQPSPLWLGGLGTWTVHAGRARAALTVGRYDLAARYGACAAEAVPAEQVWQRVLVLLDLAAACLGLREVERAAEHAGAALDLTRLLVNPFDGLVAERLDRVAKGLAAWSEVPGAQEWGTRYRQAMALVTEAEHRGVATRDAGHSGRPSTPHPEPQPPGLPTHPVPGPDAA